MTDLSVQLLADMLSSHFKRTGKGFGGWEVAWTGCEWKQDIKRWFICTLHVDGDEFTNKIVFRLDGEVLKNYIGYL